MHFLRKEFNSRSFLAYYFESKFIHIFTDVVLIAANSDVTKMVMCFRQHHLAKKYYYHWLWNSRTCTILLYILSVITLCHFKIIKQFMSWQAKVLIAYLLYRWIISFNVIIIIIVIVIIININIIVGIK